PTIARSTGWTSVAFLFGKSAIGRRQTLLTFIGPELVAERWKQWRICFIDTQPTGLWPQRLPGIESSNARMAGYPKIYNYNIERDANENLNVAALLRWVTDPALQGVLDYERSVKEQEEQTVPPLAVRVTPHRVGQCLRQSTDADWGRAQSGCTAAGTRGGSRV